LGLGKIRRKGDYCFYQVCFAGDIGVVILPPRLKPGAIFIELLSEFFVICFNFMDSQPVKLIIGFGNIWFS